MRIHHTRPSVPIFQFLIGALLLWSGTACTQDYDAGRSAYINGDYPQAYEILLPLAEAGNAEAQKIIGIMYDYGQGVEKDKRAALDWFIRSAEQGQPAVQYQVGAKYFRGDGIQQDYGEAARWWEKAAAGGQVDAQFNLGLMYYRGLHVPRDHKRAAELFQAAAEQGHSYSQFSLAVMYSYGQGVQKDHHKALEWFTKSADQGVAQAQFNLGVYYENGHGVERNLETARKWYQRAAAQDLKVAQDKLAHLDSDVTLAMGGPAVEYSEDELIAGSKSSTDPAAPAAEPPATVDSPVTEPDTVLDVPMAGDGIRREDWVRSQSRDTYTLQIASVLKEDDIVNFIKALNIESEVAYVRVRVNDVTRYNALYGRYDSFDAARQALENMPEGLRKAGPWVRNFGVLQDIME